jgi:(1->4)-alpha-D-glucan 1-alpha-D-glucosylmutase
MRIAVLSWIAEEWAAAVGRWLALSEPFRSPVGAPDDVERYFIFQTLVGAMPIEPERLDRYWVKALREAKRNSTWIEPNLEWEAGVRAFVRAALSDRDFRADFDPFCARVAALGRRAALGQLVLKLTSPGVPDIYQGDELEFRALVDPDNRRPVDFSIRRALLARLLGGGHLPEEPKLWVTAKLLGLRARRPEVFASGDYEPLDLGPDTCAFVRGGAVMSVVRIRGSGGGGPVATPAGQWRSVLGEIDGVAVYERP